MLSGTLAAQTVEESAPAATVPMTEVLPATTIPATEPPVIPNVGATIELQIPAYHLSQLSIDANVVADRVNLDITIEVVINRGTGWHRVPLRLGQAHIWSREYEGPGEEAPETVARPGDEGIVWLFRGIGRHQLRLQAWTSLQRTVAGGQFQLSLPTLPAQFEARLNVTIPEETAIIRPARNLTILPPVRSNGKTTVEASVLGNRLDFGWQSPAVGGAMISRVQSVFDVRPTAEILSMKVNQTIELQQVASDQFEVRLPSDFRLVRVSGRDGRGYLSHEPIPDRPDWVRVRVSNENLGVLELQWELEREMPDDSQSFRINGFQVQGAVREEGRINLFDFENTQLLLRRDESQFVHRQAVNQLQRSGAEIPRAAFEYLKQPFSLVLDVQPLQPYFSTVPRYQLSVQEDSLELALRCPLRIERGALSEMEVEWPGWIGQGWQVVSANLEGVQGEAITQDVTSQPGVIRLAWSNALEATTENAVLVLQFRRPLRAPLAKEIPFTLPRPQASQIDAGSLDLSMADALEVNLTMQNGAPLPRAPEERGGAVSPRPAEVASGSGRYHIDDPELGLMAGITRHERQVTANTMVEIQEATADSILLDQVIQLNVKYGRLRSIQLVLPPELGIEEWEVPESLDIRLGGERLDVVYSSGMIRADFPRAVIGDVEVRIAYRFPTPETPTTDITLPLISLSEIPFRRAQCLVEPTETIEVRTGSTGWEAVRTSPLGNLWINPGLEGNIVQVPLAIGQQVAETSQQYGVDRVLVRTRVGVDGVIDSWVEFQLDSLPSRMIVQFPPQAALGRFYVDGVPLDESAISIRSEDLQYVTLTLPEVGSQPRVSVRYRTERGSQLGLTDQLSIQFPQFSESVWVNETLWELQLPFGYHLFTYPPLEAEFEWSRHVFYWRREATPEYLSARNQFTTSRIPQEFLFQPGQFYPFRGFGPIRDLRFRAMNRSLILLIGAGFTLLLGFVFWKIPGTRNIFSLLVLSFCFAVASLWYAEPMLLLLQPSLLGLALAIAATLIDSSGRRQLAESGIYRPDRPSKESSGEISARNQSTRLYRPVGSGRSDRVKG